MPRLRWLLSLLLLLCLPNSARATFSFDNPFLNVAKTATPTPQKKAPTREAYLALQKQLADELGKAREAQDNPPVGLGPEELDFLKKRVQLLEGLDQSYGDILESLRNQADLQDRGKQLEADLAAWKTGTPPKEFPLDFAQLDKLRGQQIDLKKSNVNFRKLLNSQQDILDQAKKELENAEQNRRKIKEAAEGNHDPAATTQLEQALTLAQLRSTLAETKIDLRGLELNRLKTVKDVRDQRKILNMLQLAFLEKRVHFTDEDLKKELYLLETESNKLNNQLEAARKSMEAADRDYNAARKRLDDTNSPSSALVEEVEARRLAKRNLQQTVQILTEEMKKLQDRQDVWSHRYQLLNHSADKAQITVWDGQTRQNLEQLAREEDSINVSLNNWRDAAVQLEEKRRSKSEADAETQRWMQKQKDTIQTNLDLYQNYLSNVLLTQKLNERFAYELRAQLSHVTFRERAAGVWRGFLGVWNFELTSVDDSPITVSKILTALILIFGGLLLSRRLSRTFAERVLPRIGIKPGVAAGLQTLSFYGLLFFTILLALHMVKVPLTLFAVLGGAVAIGVGFGSQNLMNNFISGLIMLMERPVKIGDIVEIENTAGIIEEIGGRSTRIRTFNNTHLIVPNSHFLEKNVINWTFIDDMVRTSISIGVAYGSDTRDVAARLKAAAMSHDKVLKIPEPVVLFSDFGDDSLQFELHIWLRMNSTLERRLTESDLRFTIDHSFREAGIAIAFPQRDVHLDTLRPLDVRLVDKNGNVG